MQRKNVFLFLFFAFASNSNFYLPEAHAGNGTHAMEFLNLGVGSRQVGMGEAAVGLADDGLAGTFWNPAALGRLYENEVSLLYTRLVEDINYQYGAFLAPTLNHGAWALSYQRIDFGRIDTYDSSDRKTGSVSPSATAMSLHWGKQWWTGLALGAGLKYAREDLAAASASTPLAEAGMLYQAMGVKWLRGASLGVAVKNIGQGVRFEGSEESLPQTTTLGIGFATLANQVKLAADFVQTANEELRMRAGLELSYRDLLSVRGGYQTGRDLGNGMSFGFGIHALDVQVNYALAGWGDFGSVHHLGVSYRFGGKTRALYSAGMNRMQEKKYGEAILYFNQLLDLDPSHRRALMRLEECQEALLKLQGQ